MDVAKCRAVQDFSEHCLLLSVAHWVDVFFAFVYCPRRWGLASPLGLNLANSTTKTLRRGGAIGRSGNLHPGHNKWQKKDLRRKWEKKHPPPPAVCSQTCALPFRDSHTHLVLWMLKMDFKQWTVTMFYKFTDPRRDEVQRICWNVPRKPD